MSLMLKVWEYSNYTVASIFRANAEKHPNKAAFLIDDKKMTFQEVSLKEDSGNDVKEFL